MNLVKRSCVDIGVVITMSYYYSILSKQFANIDNIRQAKDMKTEMENEINSLIDTPKEFTSTSFETITLNPLEYDNNGFKFVYNNKMEIRKGDKVAIIGENGSGKTTLLYLLMGIYECKDGGILLNGEVADSARLRALMSYIDVDSDLFDDIVQDYIFANVDNNGETTDVVEEFKLIEFLESSSVSLSGGERRRIDLARTIIECRDIIAMDEPEVYLDCYWKEKVITLLKNREKTVVFTSHDPLFIKEANKIIHV